mgnify:CR=1 FL=1
MRSISSCKLSFMPNSPANISMMLFNCSDWAAESCKRMMWENHETGNHYMTLLCHVRKCNKKLLLNKKVRYSPSTLFTST